MTVHGKEKTERAPQISVVIPVYNSEAYLEKCLDSVLASTFSDLEIICVDDGSSDRSMEILRSYAEADPRFRILTQDHQYAGAARNAGILAASGKYIHFLDSDDEILPDAYEKLCKAAREAQADVCECQYKEIRAASGEVLRCPDHRKHDRRLPLSVSSGGVNARSLIFGDVVPWNKIYLRDFLIRNGILFPDLICGEDRTFYFGVIFHTEKYIRIPDRLILHRVGNSASLDGSDIRLRHFDVEFRSFEQIWDLVKDAPVSLKRAVLENCIHDSMFYYSRAVGTRYEQEIRELLYNYWQPYIPMLGKSIRIRWWYLSYVKIMMKDRPGLYGKLVRLLNDRLTAANHHRGPAASLTMALIRAASAFIPLPSPAPGENSPERSISLPEEEGDHTAS